VAELDMADALGVALIGLDILLNLNAGKIAEEIRAETEERCPRDKLTIGCARDEGLLCLTTRTMEKTIIH
jgi:hypothetical protein